LSKKIEIVDLFAGPGGLGEGFSAAGRETATPMSIRLSVEKDAFAIQTLRLRAFLRSFEKGFPTAYYEALNGSNPFPDWATTHPANWKLAVQEAQQLELGTAGVFEQVSSILDDARERCDGLTVLIGGPPCQAYSLAGRSRNAGKKDYVAERDGRHFLYQEYVAILDRLRPAAFVMENVKGMLSSHCPPSAPMAQI
jgi:DNA (cytosine-5)-methyltransferase 1